MELPRILSAATRDRVTAVLSGPCRGYECNGLKPMVFTRRVISNGVSQVHIQCLSCGRSAAGPLKRADFPFWQDFVPWGDSLQDRHNAWLQAQLQARQAAAQSAVQARLASREERQRAYHQWLLHSPDWRDLRQRVLIRDNRLCQACLLRPATDVHHLTYELGWLPPAWELRSVCRACHERMHDWDGGAE